MNSRYYYAFDDSIPARAVNACSIASDRCPLIVNCAGNLVASKPFTTDNPRGRADYYYIYIVSGTMTVTVEDSEKIASAGSVILFPPDNHYRYSYDGAGQLSYLWVHFTGSYAETLIKKIFMKPLPFVMKTTEGNRIAGDFRRIFDIFETGSSLRTEELGCALEAMLLNTAFSVGRDTGTKGFERSLRYIHSFYSTNINVETLADMENVSYYRYIKLFSEKFGVPPAAYLINLRMNAACDLLLNTDMSIKQIGVSVGYTDAHYFSRLFKKHTGQSPKDYRVIASANYGMVKTKL